MRHFKPSMMIVALAASVPLLAIGAGLPKLPSLGGGSEAATADLGGQQEKLVADYVSANKDVLGANSKMLSALGMKTEAETAKATADALTAGATKGNLSDANKAVDEGSKAIAAAIGSKPELSAESKVLYAEGLVSLVSGVQKYVGMKDSVTSFSSGLKGASVMQAGKLQSGAYVAQTFPGNLTNLGKTMKSAVDFAKSAKIPVPAGTDDVMAALGS